jgi:hypothetical protein
MTILIAIDRRYAGFGFYKGYGWRVNLGYLAITIYMNVNEFKLFKEFIDFHEATK